MSILYHSETGPLESVIVHSPGAEIRRVLTVAAGLHPAFAMDYMGQSAITEHQKFVSLLQSSGAKVLQLVDLLNDALDNARKSGALVLWLTENFPELDIDDEPELTAEMLLGIDDTIFYAENPSFAPPFPPQKWAFFTRDIAAMTPKGLIVSNFVNPDRAIEPHMARLIFQHARFFVDIPIAFDAIAENVFIQGGDVLIYDEDTLLVGIHNFTEKRAAQRLAQKLDMRVVAVSLPQGLQPDHIDYQEFPGLNFLFLHLDSVLTFVSDKHFLVTPYWFEQTYHDRDPLSEILLNLKPVGEQQKQVVTMLQEVGWVTIFEPGTGQAINTKTKIVNWLMEQGHTPIFVGGDPRNVSNAHQHVLECVLPEVRFQAANVLALRPGEVIAYDDVPLTAAELQHHGIQVRRFAGRELRRWNGGPRCMSLPIRRALL